jgi:hypothetical protein
MLIQNAVIVTDTKKIYKSWHRHDYISFDVNGESYFIDGGNEYVRTSVPPEHPHIKWMCLNDDDDVQLVIDTYVSKDEGGNNVLIKEMSMPEIEKVLERIKHPLVEEALQILLSQKTSLLDMIIES